MGLARELHEELGIAIETPRPLIRVRHCLSQRDVLLDVWVVRRYRGEPRGLDGQALRWCSGEELEAVELLPADGPIVAALWLPERLTEAFDPRGFAACGARILPRPERRLTRGRITWSCGKNWGTTNWLRCAKRSPCPCMRADCPLGRPGRWVRPG